MMFQEHILSVYDYVIVGAGACGCVLANRLSEDASKTVLLLEAGGDDRDEPKIRVPAECMSLQMTDYDWQFQTTPEKNAFKAYKNQVFTLPRGKGLGGSGSINYMVWMRGTPHDYDIWKNMGCTGWGYKDVLPYFIKMEACLVNKLGDSGLCFRGMTELELMFRSMYGHRHTPWFLNDKLEYRGTDGPTKISEAGYTELSRAIVEGAKELGYPETDCNGPNPIGFMMVQTNTADGRRQSSADVYLRPASSRTNLHIAIHSYVTRVLVHKKIARGVEFVRGLTNQLCTVRAKREVILCGGAIGSPQLLMLSGIGPASHLQSLGIDIVADLPVGDNLQEHLGMYGLEFEVDEPITVPGSTIHSPDNHALFEKYSSGPLAAGIIASVGYLRTEAQDPGNPNPDTLAGIFPTLFTSGDGKFKANTYMKEEFHLVWDAIFGGNADKHGFGCCLFLTHPKSRGTIRLASKDPFDKPLIDFKCFSHPDDLRTMLAGIKNVLKLSETKSMKEIGTRFTSRVLPGYTGQPYTDEYWEEFARTLTSLSYHISCACRMGPIDDSRTVVDPYLRVKSVERLRVVDSSIFPEIPSANLYAPSLMVAEKAADIIKGRQLISHL